MIRVCRCTASANSMAMLRAAPPAATVSICSRRGPRPSRCELLIRRNCSAAFAQASFVGRDSAGLQTRVGNGNVAAILRQVVRRLATACMIGE